MRYNKPGLLFFICVIGFSFKPTYFNIPEDVLKDSLLLQKNGNECEIIFHAWYTLCYNEKHEQASWVAYILTDSMCLQNRTKRSNKFYVDTLITRSSASPDDYARSGYDRGHLCPAGDMKFSELAMRESFYMSNVCPQNPSFNRGAWKKLEEHVRAWAIGNKKLYIVTGGILQDSLPFIGVRNKISVPEYFYKIILDYEEPEKKAIGFIMPNLKITGSVFTYAVSIDSIEAVTGIDFFYSLPDTIEAPLEAKPDTLLWNKFM